MELLSSDIHSVHFFCSVFQKYLRKSARTRADIETNGIFNIYGMLLKESLEFECTSRHISNFLNIGFDVIGIIYRKMIFLNNNSVDFHSRIGNKKLCTITRNAQFLSEILVESLR